MVTKVQVSLYQYILTHILSAIIKSLNYFLQN